jgi:hypothetical protein
VPAGGPLTDTELLDTIQHAAFQFFLSESDTSNGLLRDRSQPGSPASIASNGFGFSALCIGVERGWITREDARYRVKKALNTYLNGPQGFQASGYMGYRGLFYHFLDMNTGLRTWTSELSTIDTALLMAGVLDAMEFFDGAHPDEVAIRTTADSLYRRVDWEFMRNFGAGIRLGWKPETGFSGFGNWIGYNEAMILYILAIGSPTHPVPTFTWNTWTSVNLVQRDALRHFAAFDLDLNPPLHVQLGDLALGGLLENAGNTGFSRQRGGKNKQAKKNADHQRLQAGPTFMIRIGRALQRAKRKGGCGFWVTGCGKLRGASSAGPKPATRHPPCQSCSPHPTRLCPLSVWRQAS